MTGGAAAGGFAAPSVGGYAAGDAQQGRRGGQSAVTASRVEIRRGTYHDSVTLMQVSRQAEQLPGVEAAAAVAATPVNLDLLARQGFAVDPAGLGPSDLVVCVRAADEDTADQAMEEVAALLAGPSGAGSGASAGTAGGPVVPPRSLRAAARRDPDLNLAVLSVPGRHLHYEILQALQAGLHVFCFSDGLDPAAEAACKRFAVDRGLLLMGPDCGTAILDGVGLGFANAVRQGPVGVVGASGTGIQEVTCLLDAAGTGISHAIGVGGRDLSPEVGGIMTLRALELLAADPATERIVVISKPPDPEVARRVADAAAATGKPAILAFPGMPAPPPLPDRVRFAGSLEAAAAWATQGPNVVEGMPQPQPPARGVLAASGPPQPQPSVGGILADSGPQQRQPRVGGVPAAEGTPQPQPPVGGAPTGRVAGRGERGDPLSTGLPEGSSPAPTPATAPAPATASAPASASTPATASASARPTLSAAEPPPAVTHGMIRGLFCGGTLCYEAMAVVAGVVGRVASNIPLRAEWRLGDSSRSEGHTFVDFGDDALTEGRAHPMIDPGLRNERFRREAADPETGVVLLDVVLGYGAHPDPAGELAPLIGEALAGRAGGLSVVVSLCGAADDPQGLDGQAAALRAAGALVTRSSAQAARLALAAAGLDRGAPKPAPAAPAPARPRPLPGGLDQMTFRPGPGPGGPGAGLRPPRPAPRPDREGGGRP
jgi:FdrA protein